MINLKGHKGITLIALIITIIVLLILAGVAIAQISGQDSAPEKATEAKRKNDEGAEFDAIKVAVVGAVANGNNGLVDAESLKNELNGLVEDEGRLAIRSDNAPWIVVGKTGKVYEITATAMIRAVEPLNITSSLTITENKVKSITVSKYSSAVGKQVSWTKEGNIIFVTDETGATEVQNPTSDTVYIKAGAYTDGTTGKVTVSASDEESQECNITITEKEWSKIGEEVAYTSKYEADVQKTNPNFKIGWRLFYRDDDYTYIIADRVSTSYEPEVDSAKTGKYAPWNYNSSYDANSFTSNKNVAKFMNPLLANTDTTKELFNSNPLNKAMKTLAWLCDTDNWKDFTQNGTDASQGGEYAIACPPLELYAKSYNLAAEEAGLNNKISELTLNDYGYDIPSSDYSFGIFARLSWLSSLNNSSSMFVSQNGSPDVWSKTVDSTYVNINNRSTYGYALRPLVAIPNANFDFATLTVK